MNKLISLFIILLLISGCGADQNVPDSDFDESPVLNISVLKDGKVLVDGDKVSIEELDMMLADTKSREGVVWYYRENAAEEPDEIAEDVLELIIEHKLPVKLSQEPDFSDSI